MTTCAGALHESGFGADEAAADELGLAFDFSAQLVDGEDGENEAVFGKVAAIADDEVFNDVGGGAGVDANAASGDFAVFAGVTAVELEDRRRFPW